MDWNSFETVNVEIQNRIAEVRINRPKALNALNSQVIEELSKVFEALRDEAGLACVILSGEGSKSFVAGADIAEMNGLSAEQAEVFSKRGHEVFTAIENFKLPVLAAVSGFALGGGCELALSCDIIYASEKAKFGQPEVTLGLIPGFGGTVRLPRKVGLAAASEWILTGDIYGAEEAKEMGLVRAILPHDELMDHVRKIAAKIASRAPLAVQAAKEVMVKGLATTPEAASSLEITAFGKLFSSEDTSEGTTAFLEKRKPEFTGK